MGFYETFLLLYKAILKGEILQEKLFMHPLLKNRLLKLSQVASCTTKALYYGNTLQESLQSFTLWGMKTKRKILFFITFKIKSGIQEMFVLILICSMKSLFLQKEKRWI